jgi:hypothetical protein
VTTLPTRPLVAIAGGKASPGNTLETRSTGTWTGPRWSLLNEVLPRITSSCRTDISTLLDQGKTQGTSQRDCSDLPSRQSCISSTMRSALVTRHNVKARTQFRLVWSNANITAQNHVRLNMCILTNIPRSGFHEPRRRARSKLSSAKRSGRCEALWPLWRSIATAIPPPAHSAVHSTTVTRPAGLLLAHCATVESVLL